MRRPYRFRRKPQRHPTPASEKLDAMRARVTIQLGTVARALGVHPRTLRRWEIGETKPDAEEWAKLVAFYAGFLPREAAELAALVGARSPVPEPPKLDPRAIEDAIVRAADALDVAPRRVRAAVREIVAVVAASHGSLADLARAAEEKTDAVAS